MTISDRIVATIRTGVPALIGLLIARLIAAVPQVADVIAWLDVQVGGSTTVILGAIATAAVIAGYYWLARKVGDRWPFVQRWLLGSSKIPTYVGQHRAE